MQTRIWRKRNFWFGFFVAPFFIWALNASVTKYSAEAAENLIASHDSSSSQYNKDCTNCHANIPNEKSLSPSVRNVHVTMLPFVPGENNNTKCRWCHRTVDLTQGTQRVEKSKGNLRRGVDVTLCTLCHSPSGPGKQFYQTGISPTQPDGPALYELVCAPCHRSLPNSEVRGESASEIQKKINENEGGMWPLHVLTPEEIQAIANALR